MMEGRVRAALRLLATNTHTGLHSLDEMVCDNPRRTVRDVLEEKRPDVKPAHAETIVIQSNDTQNDFYPVSSKVLHQK